MTHLPRNEEETSHQKALAGKREGIRHLPSKLLEQIRNEARHKKHCCDKYGEELSSCFIFLLCKEDDIKFDVISLRLEENSLKKSFLQRFLPEKLLNDIN